MSIALVQDYFWGEIFGRAAESPCAIIDALCKAKVGKLHVSNTVEKHILGLEITISNIKVVEILHRQDCLS